MRHDAEGGLSVVELLVATACTGLLGAAVFSLLIASATASRHRMNAYAAQRRADRAVAAVQRDVRTAGRGLEHAVAVIDGGSSLPVLSGMPRGVRIVRATAGAAEIIGRLPGPTYEVAGGVRFAPGSPVVGVDSPRRPAGAPLPVGTVVAVVPAPTSAFLTVSWGAEAALLVAWGEPRALVPFEVRELEISPAGSAWRLRRRDDSGPWQPVADGLRGFVIRWSIDGDADGLGDRWLDPLPPGSEGSVCGVSLRAEVETPRGLLRLPGGRIVRALGYVPVSNCARVAAGNTSP